MTSEQIQELALGVYPITPAYDGDEIIYHDINDELREGFIEGLQKASELLYTEQEVEDSIKEGVNIGIRESKNPKAVRYNVVEREVKEYIQSLKQQ